MYDPREPHPLSMVEQSHAEVLAAQNARAEHLYLLGLLLHTAIEPHERAKQNCLEVLKARLCEPEIVSLVQAIFTK